MGTSWQLVEPKITKGDSTLCCKDDLQAPKCIPIPEQYNKQSWKPQAADCPKMDQNHT